MCKIECQQEVSGKGSLAHPLPGQPLDVERQRSAPALLSQQWTAKQAIPTKTWPSVTSLVDTYQPQYCDKNSQGPAIPGLLLACVVSTALVSSCVSSPTEEDPMESEHRKGLKSKCVSSTPRMKEDEEVKEDDLDSRQRQNQDYVHTRRAAPRSDALPSQTVAPTTNLVDHLLNSIAGLSSVISHLGLQSHASEIRDWCSQAGAAYLEEVAHNVEELCDDIELTAIERSRFVAWALRRRGECTVQFADPEREEIEYTYDENEHENFQLVILRDNDQSVDVDDEDDVETVDERRGSPPRRRPRLTRAQTTQMSPTRVRWHPPAFFSDSSQPQQATTTSSGHLQRFTTTIQPQPGSALSTLVRISSMEHMQQKASFNDAQPCSVRDKSKISEDMQQASRDDVQPCLEQQTSYDDAQQDGLEPCEQMSERAQPADDLAGQTSQEHAGEHASDTWAHDGETTSSSRQRRW